jgi:hypothetical protein
MQLPVALGQSLKKLSINNKLIREIGADIDLLSELDIGSREAFWINAFKRPSGSLPAEFSTLDPGARASSAELKSETGKASALEAFNDRTELADLQNLLYPYDADQEQKRAIQQK